MHPGIAAAGRPTLHLSGPKLRATLESLIVAAEPVGGVERLPVAVKLKAQLFRDNLADGRAASIERPSFVELVRFLPTVRRRFARLVEHLGWPAVQGAVATLLMDASLPESADARIAVFEGSLRIAGSSSAPVPAMMGSAGRARRNDRFLRDFAAELLHAVYPEHYPLMTRWMWDAATNTGVLREIWHDKASGSDDVDHIVIDLPDGYETFLVLREELSQFLTDNGVFRDMPWYVDVICAHVYAGYINAQGGAFLKTDFNAVAADPLEHTLRILGLDAWRRMPRQE